SPDITTLHTGSTYPSPHTVITYSFFTASPTTAVSPLSLHDALPISRCHLGHRRQRGHQQENSDHAAGALVRRHARASVPIVVDRSEEHTSELQSRENLVCRLLLEKKKYSASGTGPATRSNTIARCST